MTDPLAGFINERGRELTSPSFRSPEPWHDPIVSWDTGSESGIALISVLQQLSWITWASYQSQPPPIVQTLLFRARYDVDVVFSQYTCYKIFPFLNKPESSPSSSAGFTDTPVFIAARSTSTGRIPNFFKEVFWPPSWSDTCRPQRSQRYKQKLGRAHN